LTPLADLNNNQQKSEFINKQSERKGPDCIREQKSVFNFLTVVTIFIFLGKKRKATALLISRATYFAKEDT